MYAIEDGGGLDHSVASTNQIGGFRPSGMLKLRFNHCHCPMLMPLILLESIVVRHEGRVSIDSFSVGMAASVASNDRVAGLM